MPARAKLPPGKGKRVPLNMRTTREVRERLEKNAADSGRSLTQEVEYHLARSLGRDEMMAETWGGSAAMQVWLTCASAAKTLSAKADADWLDDTQTFAQVKSATELLFDIFGPEGRVPARKVADPTTRMAAAHCLWRLGFELAALPVPDAKNQQSEYDATVLKAAKAFRKIV